MFKAYGLYSHIRKNRLKSLFLLAAFVLLIHAVLLSLVLIIEAFTHGGTVEEIWAAALERMRLAWPVGLVGCLIWFVIAFAFHQRMIDFATRAKGVERNAEPRLYNALENLCISRGIAMPKLKIIETGATNAFASGLRRSNYSVAVTRGLLDNLTDRELDAVLAHELTHIRNKDTQMMVIAVIFAGIIAFVGDLSFRRLDFPFGYSPRKDDDLQDRPGRDTKSERCQMRCIGEGAEERPCDRRQAGNRGQRHERRSAHRDRGDRRSNAQSLGDVVNAKAKHQVGSERDLAGGKRGADGQPFSKIVQSDADSDEERQRHALGRAALAASGGEKDDQGQHSRRPEERGGAKPSDGAFGNLQAFADGVKKQKRQQPNGQTEKEAPHARPRAAHGGMESKPDCHRNHAEQSADGGEKDEGRAIERRRLLGDFDRMVDERARSESPERYGAPRRESRDRECRCGCGQARPRELAEKR